MLDLLKTGLCLIFELLLFPGLGGVILRKIGWKTDRFSFLTEECLHFVAGFFAYHLLFSIVALPLILTGSTLTLLIRIWTPVLFLLSLGRLFLFLRRKGEEARSFFLLLAEECRRLFSRPVHLILLLLSLIGVAAVLLLSLSASYGGWDRAFYVRTVLSAVTTDAMYTLEASFGVVTDSIFLRYALSPFYMNAALFCRLTNVHPLIFEHWCDGTLCILLSFSAVRILAESVFPKNCPLASTAVWFTAILHIAGSSLSAPSDFLILRSYEAKALCANVVLPFLFALFVRLWKDPAETGTWPLLFLACAASVPVSMSSLITVPLLAAGASLFWLLSGSFKSIGRVVLCLLVNAVFLALYGAAILGILTLSL